MTSSNLLPIMFAAVLTGAAVAQPSAASTLSLAPAVNQSNSTQTSSDMNGSDSTTVKTKGTKHHSKKHKDDTLNNATGRGGAGGTTGLAGGGVSDSSNANSGGSGTQTGGAGNVGRAPGAGTKSNSVPSR